MRFQRPRSAHGGTETGALCRPRQFFSPTRAARAAPALNQLRLLGFSFLNSFSFWVVTRRDSAAVLAVVSTDDSKDAAVVAIASRMVHRFAAPFLAGLCAHSIASTCTCRWLHVMPVFFHQLWEE